MAKPKVDTALIETLAELLQRTGLTEIELAEGDSRIRVARQPQPVVASVPAMASAPASSGPAATEAVGDGSGDYIATIPGQGFASPLGLLLHRRVWIVAESVPPGSYRDAFPVTVVEDQSA